MKIDARKKICDLVNELPSAARILNDLGIDAFHNNNRSLWDACTNSGIPIASAVEKLRKAEEVGREKRSLSGH
jgi:iron-sulfur cluster repair protein YtfE (RIC family)